jgi:Vacuolar sorting protein 9 (VPS9) domain
MAGAGRHCMHILRVLHTSQDRALDRALLYLRGQALEELGIDPLVADYDFSAAITCIRKLEVAPTPIEKLRCLRSTMHAITQATSAPSRPRATLRTPASDARASLQGSSGAESSVKRSGGDDSLEEQGASTGTGNTSRPTTSSGTAEHSGSSTPKVIGTDRLLPMLIYVVLQARPAALCSQTSFIRLHIADDLAYTELGFHYTSYQACQAFLEETAIALFPDLARLPHQPQLVDGHADTLSASLGDSGILSGLDSSGPTLSTSAAELRYSQQGFPTSSTQSTPEWCSASPSAALSGTASHLASGGGAPSSFAKPPLTLPRFLDEQQALLLKQANGSCRVVVWGSLPEVGCVCVCVCVCLCWLVVVVVCCCSLQVICAFSFVARFLCFSASLLLLYFSTCLFSTPLCDRRHLISTVLVTHILNHTTCGLS